MQLGIVGMGRMGANLVRRPRRAGHDCVVYDVRADPVQTLAEGATDATSLDAEGLNILRNADAGTVTRTADAGTTPMTDPQH